MGAPQTALTSNNGERPQTIDVGACAGARERPVLGSCGFHQTLL